MAVVVNGNLDLLSTQNAGLKAGTVRSLEVQEIQCATLFMGLENYINISGKHKPWLLELPLRLGSLKTKVRFLCLRGLLGLYYKNMAQRIMAMVVSGNQDIW